MTLPPPSSLLPVCHDVSSLPLPDPSTTAFLPGSQPVRNRILYKPWTKISLPSLNCGRIGGFVIATGKSLGQVPLLVAQRCHVGQPWPRQLAAWVRCLSWGECPEICFESSHKHPRMKKEVPLGCPLSIRTRLRPQPLGPQAQFQGSRCSQLEGRGTSGGDSFLWVSQKRDSFWMCLRSGQSSGTHSAAFLGWRGRHHPPPLTQHTDRCWSATQQCFWNTPAFPVIIFSWSCYIIVGVTKLIYM